MSMNEMDYSLKSQLTLNLLEGKAVKRSGSVPVSAGAPPQRTPTGWLKRMSRRKRKSKEIAKARFESK